jgi:hypothetical protein
MQERLLRLNLRAAGATDESISNFLRVSFLKNAEIVTTTLGSAGQAWPASAGTMIPCRGIRCGAVPFSGNLPADFLGRKLPV